MVDSSPERTMHRKPNQKAYVSHTASVVSAHKPERKSKSPILNRRPSEIMKMKRVGITPLSGSNYSPIP